MMDDSARREKKQLQTQQRASARAAFPLANANLEVMFDAVDDRLSLEPCDDTLRLTESWLASNGHAVAAVVDWLHDNGGYCNCEVVANVRDHWEQVSDDIHPTVKLAVELLATSRGGRSSSVYLRAGQWRPHLKVSASSEPLGVAFVRGPTELFPGSRSEAVAWLVYADNGVDYSALQPGTVVDILEGVSVVGRARVLARFNS